jgi:site-specific DNA recombinase
VRVGIYTRISSDQAGEGLGVARQLSDCEALCHSRGWEVVGRFEDNDVSAYSGKRRPAYQALLLAIARSEVDCLVAWHPDRLHRSPRELENFIDLVERTRCQVVTVTAGTLDLSTPEGRLTARIVGSVARKESEDKSRRLKRKHLELAEGGKPHGGGRCFGYDGHQQIIPAEAELLRNTATRLLAGESLIGITRTLGLKPVRSDSWTTGKIKSVMLRPTIAGIRIHNGREYPAIWKPILDEDTWRRVVALLTDPVRGNGRRHGKFMLSGLVTCECGNRMLRTGGELQPRYVCRSEHQHPGQSGCGRCTIHAIRLEDLVWAATLELLEDPANRERLAAMTQTSDSRAVLDAVATDETRLEALRAQVADGTLDVLDFNAMKARITERVEASLRSIRPNAVPANVNDALTPDQRRAVVDACWPGGFTILRANRRGGVFRPERVSPAQTPSA